MQQGLYDAFPWSSIAVCLITAFLVWGSSPSKRQKVQGRYPNTSYWERRALELVRQLRENDLEARRKIDELQKKLHDERNKKR